MVLALTHFFYRYIARPIIFLFDSERVHNGATDIGSFLGSYAPTRNAIKWLFRVRHPSLETVAGGVAFKNPVGLSAGFDYNARLTQIVPSIGFGFGTVGTVTNQPYEGNTPPRLGRLVQSRSLMVNKGFKSAGVDLVLAALADKNFDIPIGMSVGKTNKKEPMTLDEAIDDIVATIKRADGANVPFAYYEINISCPNLHGNVSFYNPQNLEKLLANICALHSTRPLWVKMPIEKSNDEVIAMLDVVVKYPISAVIFGNLQKDRTEPTLISTELAPYPVGNFSGKATWRRSNELIELAYRHCGTKVTIVGCGGVFSAEDAYNKICLGASLVEMITGLIFEGPQLPAEINSGLVALLKRDGFLHIAEAVGKDAIKK